MDEFLILLQAKLDETKSQNNINEDIEILQGKLDKLKLQATIDPKTVQTLAKEIEKVINQKIVISNIGIDSKTGVKVGQEYGKQISQGISQGMSTTSKTTEKILRDFSELNDAKRKFVDEHDLISNNDITDAEKLYDTVRNAFSEFGQVTVSKGSMNDGSLENMRVKIEQVNGEMKITRDFMLYFNESKNGFKLVDDDTIRTTEKMIQHLNEEKNIVNATNEEANAIKEKLAEQEKYYGKLGQATKEQIALEKQRITAGEKQLEILNAQSKRRDSRISYNEDQIDKKGLTDTSRQRKLNDLEYSGREKIDAAFGKELDKSLGNLSKLKEIWQEQGIYVDEFKAKVESLEKSLNEITIGDIKGLNTYKEQINSLSSEAKQLSQIHEIQLSMDNGDYDTQILSYETALQKLGLTSTEVTEKMKNVSVAYKELKNDATGDNIISNGLITKAKTLETEMSKLNNAVKQIKLKDSLQADDLQVEQTIIRLNKQLVANGKYTKDAKTKIRDMIAELEKGNVASARLKQINVEAKELHSNMSAINRSGQGFWDRIGLKINSLGTYLSAAAIISKVLSSTKNGISTVKELDTALVDLKKTTDATAQELESFYYSANDTAKQLGVTTESVIAATSAWSRLGYSIKEAQTMAENSAILTSISPDIDSIDKSTDALVSVLKAYSIDAQDSLDSVISKINIIGNTQAVSNGDIVDILTRSSSAMAAANNSLEQTIALGTAATEITRNSAEVGTALKTISMRIRGYDEETESYSEDLENLAGTIADLTKTASSPGGISLFTDESKETYKSTYQILSDIRDIWDELSDKNQAELLEALAGKRQGQIVSALISNWEAAENSMNSMANSAGNAMKEMEVIYDSLDYKLNTTAETATGIFQNLFKKEDMKSVIDVLNSFMGILDNVTEKLGLFGSLAVGAGMFTGFKNVGSPKMFGLRNCLRIYRQYVSSAGYSSLGHTAYEIHRCK